MAHCSGDRAGENAEGLPPGASEPILVAHIPAYLRVTGWGLRVKTSG